MFLLPTYHTLYSDMFIVWVTCLLSVGALDRAGEVEKLEHLVCTRRVEDPHHLLLVLLPLRRLLPHTPTRVPSTERRPALSNHFYYFAIGTELQSMLWVLCTCSSGS